MRERERSQSDLPSSLALNKTQEGLGPVWEQLLVSSEQKQPAESAHTSGRASALTLQRLWTQKKNKTTFHTATRGSKVSYHVNSSRRHETNSSRYELFHVNDVDFGCRKEKKEAADRMRTM